MSRMEKRKPTKINPNTPEGRKEAAAYSKRVESRVAVRKMAADAAAKAVESGKSVNFVKIPSKATSTKFERNQAIRMRAAQAKGVARAVATKRAGKQQGKRGRTK